MDKFQDFNGNLSINRQSIQGNPEYQDLCANLEEVLEENIRHKEQIVELRALLRSTRNCCRRSHSVVIVPNDFDDSVSKNVQEVINQGQQLEKYDTFYDDLEEPKIRWILRVTSAKAELQRAKKLNADLSERFNRVSKEEKRLNSGIFELEDYQRRKGNRYISVHASLSDLVQIRNVTNEEKVESASLKKCRELADENEKLRKELAEVTSEMVDLNSTISLSRTATAIRNNDASDSKPIINNHTNNAGPTINRKTSNAGPRINRKTSNAGPTINRKTRRVSTTLSALEMPKSFINASYSQISPPLNNFDNNSTNKDIINYESDMSITINNKNSSTSINHSMGHSNKPTLTVKPMSVLKAMKLSSPLSKQKRRRLSRNSISSPRIPSPRKLQNPLSRRQSTSSLNSKSKSNTIGTPTGSSQCIIDSSFEAQLRSANNKGGKFLSPAAVHYWPSAKKKISTIIQKGSMDEEGCFESVDLDSMYGSPIERHQSLVRNPQQSIIQQQIQPHLPPNTIIKPTNNETGNFEDGFSPSIVSPSPSSSSSHIPELLVRLDALAKSRIPNNKTNNGGSSKVPINAQKSTLVGTVSRVTSTSIVNNNNSQQQPLLKMGRKNSVTQNITKNSTTKIVSNNININKSLSSSTLSNIPDLDFSVVMTPRASRRSSRRSAHLQAH